MKVILRSVYAFLFAGLLVTAAGLSPNEAARSATRSSAFDGAWSVTIFTTRGDCDRSVRASLRIVGGRVVSDDQSFQAYGSVAPNGAIHVTVVSGNRSASGSGRLSRGGGGGHWRTGSGECSGQWQAERRNW